MHLQLHQVTTPRMLVHAQLHAQAYLHTTCQPSERRHQHRGRVGTKYQYRGCNAEAMVCLPQSISLPKLAGLLEMDGATLRAQLMLLKSTALVKTWNGSGDGTEVCVPSLLYPDAAVVSWRQLCTVC
jgi:hypothetical protein